MGEVMPLEMRAPENRASSRAVRYWTVRALSGWVVALVVVITVATQAFPHQAAAVIGAAVLVAAVHVVVMPRWRFRVHRWEVTGTAVYTQAGWLRQERRIAPIVRIQTVDTERGPFEQLFGLSKVTITTASAAGPLKIHALDSATAELLALKLTDITSAAGADGT